MTLFHLIFRSPRPAAIIKMPVRRSLLLCPHGFNAITLFGTIFCRETSFDATYPRERLLFHEHIHLSQAVNCHNSWFLFYLRYCWFSLLSGYRANPFEIEAYTNMNNPDYLKQFCGKGADGWRKYAKMTRKERKRLINKKK